MSTVIWISAFAVVDSVVPVQGGQASGVNIPAATSEGAALASMYDVDTSIGDIADNATYCRGVQPITIAPMELEGYDDVDDDVEPMVACSQPPSEAMVASRSASGRPNNLDVSRPGGEGPEHAAMRVLYCGTVSGDQLLQQNSVGRMASSDLTGTGVGDALASGSNTGESRPRNFSDPVPDGPVSGGHVQPETGVSQTPATVKRHSSEVATPRRIKQQVPSASSGRKSASSSKVRRSQSVDGGSASVRHRYVVCCVIFIIIIVIMIVNIFNVA